MFTHKHNSNLTSLAKTLRKSMTKEEGILRHTFLKDYPIRFLRQKVIDNYIVDFYCRQANLVIELDGSQHYTEQGELKDRIRTEQIEQYGITVLRIPNSEINKNLQGVCLYIDEFVKNSIKE